MDNTTLETRGYSVTLYYVAPDLSGGKTETFVVFAYSPCNALVRAYLQSNDIHGLVLVHSKITTTITEEYEL